MACWGCVSGVPRGWCVRVGWMERHVVEAHPCRRLYGVQEANEEVAGAARIRDGEGELELRSGSATEMLSGGDCLAAVRACPGADESVDPRSSIRERQDEAQSSRKARVAATVMTSEWSVADLSIWRLLLVPFKAPLCWSTD